MRKIYVEVKVRLIINADEGVDIDDVISDCDYEFVSRTPGADITDTEIQEIEIKDSK